MKKFIAIAAIGCAAVMALAACGGGNKRTGSSLEELQNKYGYQWTDPSKPILNETGAKELSFNIYSSKNASAKDYNDMDIMQTLFETTNVFVNWENVSETIYGEQKTLKLGKHNGIDAIYHAGLSANEILTYGTKRSTLLPISDYLEYMPNFSKILEARPDIKKQITNVDGKIYALPRVEEMGLLQNPNLLFINKAWTEAAVEDGVNLGGKTIEDGLELTSAQMEALLTYFKTHDMNKNGNANDERPLTFAYNTWQGNQCDLYGMFGLNDNLDHRVIVDGKVTYTVLDDAFKTATQFLHNWVANGLIDQVSFEQSQDQFLANGKGTGGDEKYGAFYWWESETVVSDPTNYVVCKPLIGPDNKQTVSVSNNPEISTGEVIFFKGTPNVEVLLTYFDRYYSPEISAQINYGPIGIAFNEEKDANGKLVAKAPPAGKTTDEIRLENAPMGLCYLSTEAWANTVEMEPRAKLRLERLEKYATPYYDHNKVKPVPNLQFTEAELNILIRYQTTIDNYLRENILSWLRNGLTDSAWETHKTKAVGNSVGIGEVQKVYQAAYDRYVAQN